MEKRYGKLSLLNVALKQSERKKGNDAVDKNQEEIQILKMCLEKG